jgi:putative ABC transport system permease protein
MKALRRFLLRFAGSITRHGGEVRLKEEIDAHLALQTAENIRVGMAPEEARRQAVLKFGAIQVVKEDYRDGRSLPAFEHLFQDIRYALRGFRKNPGFAFAAVLTLALGIGANTAMFAVVHAVLLKPLPFSEADRLMLVHLLGPDPDAGPGVMRERTWSYPKYRTFLDVQTAFDSTALFSSRELSIAGDGNAERVRAEVITDRYPGILGITPIVGRGFTGQESHLPGASPVVLLGHALWTRRFGADPAVLGRELQINARSYAVIGVLPAGFRGLSGDAELWIPLSVISPAQLGEEYSHNGYVIARRKPEISEQAAVAAVHVAGTYVHLAHPRGDGFSANGPAWTAQGVSLSASRVDVDIKQVSFALSGAVGLLFLITCVNLTNLHFAKALGRKKEIAIRMAIGSNRWRVARHFLIEGALVSVIGAFAGLALAVGLLEAGSILLPRPDVLFQAPLAPGVPRLLGAAGLTRIGAAMIEVDGIVLLFVCAITAFAIFAVSVGPALHASSMHPIEVIKKAVSCGTGHAVRMRAVLVTCQIVLATVLLIGAGLLLKSAARLHATFIGVDAGGVLTMRVSLPGRSYSSERGTAFYAQLVQRVMSLPGIESVGLGSCAPVSGGCSATGIWFPKEAPREGSGKAIVGVHWTTPDYFATLGVRLLRGRLFSALDRAGQPKVVVVNEAAARAFWPNESPVGKVVALGQGDFHDGAEVVGVVANVRYHAIEAEPVPDVYLPLAQSYVPGMQVFVRTRNQPENLERVIRREMRVLDPHLPISDVRTMEQSFGEAMWRTRVAAWLFSTFAALALLLTAVGIFGVMAQTVSQQTPEIGVRMALGAQRRDILARVLWRGLLIATAGLGAGAVAALALSRLMTILLYGVEPTDPLTFALVVVVMGIVALAACYVPARRAARVDPLVALRY